MDMQFYISSFVNLLFKQLRPRIHYVGHFGVAAQSDSVDFNSAHVLGISCLFSVVMAAALGSRYDGMSPIF